MGRGIAQTTVARHSQVKAMQKWWHDHGLLLACVMLAVTLGGIIVVILFLRRLPADYFVAPPRRSPQRSVWDVVRNVVRNVAGIALLILGLFLSLPLIPGPGVLAILVGLSLTNFPGKRKVEICILRLPYLLSWI